MKRSSKLLALLLLAALFVLLSIRDRMKKR